MALAEQLSCNLSSWQQHPVCFTMDGLDQDRNSSSSAPPPPERITGINFRQQQWTSWHVANLHRLPGREKNRHFNGNFQWETCDVTCTRSHTL